MFAILLLRPLFMFRQRRYIKQSRECFITFPNTSKFIKNGSLHILNSLLSVWKCDETILFVFDILRNTITYETGERADATSMGKEEEAMICKMAPSCVLQQNYSGDGGQSR